MNIKNTWLSLTLVFILITAVYASKFIQLGIGPVWPVELLDHPSSTAWSASFAFGGIIDKKVGLGADFDFLWNHRLTEQHIQGTNAYLIDNDVKTFMFPISAFLLFNPIPDYLVSPTIWGQIGLNNMYYSDNKDSTFTNNTIPNGSLGTNGFYMGFIWKIAADAQYRIGDNTSIYAGLLYQGSQNSLLKISNSNIEIRRDMSGFGLRAGFRIGY
jgi:hypothetical protein